ncbi:MAG TPA: glycosyltransferase [Thermoanaerobaculia bacterium]|jgi:glycosyltransferase involved in cell wall biosynthesis|nr:glycosyltransferase [Thermoanaerobaculia bacterium]
MKSLVIAPRFPWPAYTGDRLRASIWIEALRGSGEVALIAPRGTIPADARMQFYAARPSLRRTIGGAMTLLRERLPLQCLPAARYDWPAAIANARLEMGPFDVTIVLLSRMHPWVRASLQGRTILDAIDSLGRSAAERRKAASPLLRWIWTIEERRMVRLERGLAQNYGEVIVVSDDETAEFGGATAVTIGVPARPLDDGARGYDFGFWGRLAYFANADAAAWLLREIWPAIRALRPAATLIIGGADAPRALRNDARRGGVTLLSPVGDMAAFARHIRVALMPLRYGSGQATKVLEAAEAGCAIVGSPTALRGLGALAPHACVESAASGFARAAVDLLTDADARARMSARLRETIATHYDRANALARLSAIAATGTR